MLWLTFSYPLKEQTSIPISNPIENTSPSIETIAPYFLFEYLNTKPLIVINKRCVSEQRYLSSDGIEVPHRENSYKSVSQAKNEFHNALSGEIEIILRKPILMNQGVKVGESAVIVHLDKVKNVNIFTDIRWIEKTVYRSYSTSQLHLLFFVNNHKPMPFGDVCSQ